MEMNEPSMQADPEHVKHVIEACLLVAGRVMSMRELEAVFEEDESPRPGRDALREALAALQSDYEGRAVSSWWKSPVAGACSLALAWSPGCRACSRRRRLVTQGRCLKRLCLSRIDNR